MYNLGYYDNAIQDYNKAIKYNLKNDMVYNNRALVRQKMGDYEGAIQDLITAVELNPEPINI